MWRECRRNGCLKECWRWDYSAEEGRDDDVQDGWTVWWWGQRLDRKSRGQSGLEEGRAGSQSPPRAVVLLLMMISIWLRYSVYSCRWHFIIAITSTSSLLLLVLPLYRLGSLTFALLFSPGILSSVVRNFCLVVHSRPHSWNTANSSVEFNVLFVWKIQGFRDVTPCRLVNIYWWQFIHMVMRAPKLALFAPDYIYFFPMARQPLGGLGRLIFEASRSLLRHTTLGRTPLDEWPARRRYLYLITQTVTTDRHPCPQRNSNPQSQQASGRRPTP
jgi:hypothetical protein